MSQISHPPPCPLYTPASSLSNMTAASTPNVRLDSLTASRSSNTPDRGTSSRGPGARGAQGEGAAEMAEGAQGEGVEEKAGGAQGTGVEEMEGVGREEEEMEGAEGVEEAVETKGGEGWGEVTPSSASARGQHCTTGRNPPWPWSQPTKHSGCELPLLPLLPLLLLLQPDWYACRMSARASLPSCALWGTRLSAASSRAAARASAARTCGVKVGIQVRVQGQRLGTLACRGGGGFQARVQGQYPNTPTCTPAMRELLRPCVHACYEGAVVPYVLDYP